MLWQPFAVHSNSTHAPSRAGTFTCTPVSDRARHSGLPQGTLSVFLITRNSHRALRYTA